MKTIIIDKPWGHEKIWAKTDKYVGKVLTIDPGEKLSRQYHENKDETIYVLDGVLVLELGQDDEIIKMVMKKGASFHIKPGTVHRFAAPSDGCELMEVSTPELDDVVRLEDAYGRS
jgi:quercetin dioxygenase-like cupin family protein